VNGDNNHVGTEVVSLLKEQRNLYHQLKELTARQQQLAGANSPELLLQIISGRRKLIGKLHQLNDKLRLIRAGWPNISVRINSEHKAQARQMVHQTKKIYEQIMESAPVEVVEQLTENDAGKLDGLFAE